MINFRIKNPGETLTEVLVAVGIITVVLTNSLMLVNRGTSTNISIKNKILAINIAREGIEATRNIRDTNWLKYSGDKKRKWLCLDKIKTVPNPDEIDPCSSTISSGKYIVDFNNDLSRFFAIKEVAQTDKLDLSVPANFSNYRLYKDGTSKRYTHNSTGNTETLFYRQLELTPEVVPNCGNNACTEITRLHIIARVQWKESELVGTVVLETYLYNYLNRTNY
jgi:hypothetical protein